MTNGYGDTVINALERLAWKQPTLKGYDIIDTANQVSTSGRYYNDDSFNTAVTVQNIKDCQSDDRITEEDFNAYLVQLRKSVILAALTAVFDTPQFIESGLLFRKLENVQNNPIANAGKFVGIRLKVSEGAYGVNLKNALLFFNGDVAFDLYLFHSITNGTEVSGNTTTDVPYIKKWAVTAKGNSQTVAALNYTINGESAKGGVWFLGYFQSALGSVKALDYSPVTNCYNIVGGVSFESTANVGNTDFDRETYGKSAGCYGINLEFSSYNDQSEQIINNAHLFDSLQGLMMAAKVIELIQNSTRLNTNKRLSAEAVNALIVQLEGLKTEAGQWIPGIRSAIGKEVRQLKAAFTNEDKGITIATAR